VGLLKVPDKIFQELVKAYHTALVPSKSPMRAPKTTTSFGTAQEEVIKVQVFLAEIRKMAPSERVAGHFPRGKPIEVEMTGYGKEGKDL
jgi:hypothetical protein